MLSVGRLRLSVMMRLVFDLSQAHAGSVSGDMRGMKVRGTHGSCRVGVNSFVNEARE